MVHNIVRKAGNGCARKHSARNPFDFLEYFSLRRHINPIYRTCAYKAGVPLEEREEKLLEVLLWAHKLPVRDLDFPRAITASSSSGAAASSPPGAAASRPLVLAAAAASSPRGAAASRPPGAAAAAASSPPGAAASSQPGVAAVVASSPPGAAARSQTGAAAAAASSPPGAAANSQSGAGGLRFSQTAKAGPLGPPTAAAAPPSQMTPPAQANAAVLTPSGSVVLLPVSSNFSIQGVSKFKNI